MTAQLIPPGAPEFRARFAAFSYSVFRLETLQSYGNSGEDAAFAASSPISRHRTSQPSRSGTP